MSARSVPSVREQVVVPVAGPLDLDSTVGFLHSRDDPFVRRREDGSARAALRTGKGPAVVEIRLEGDELRVDMLLAKGADPDAALAGARQLAGLSADPDAPDHHAAFVRRARKEPALREILRACKGLRMPQRPDPVLSVSGAVIAQQITTSFAAKLSHVLWTRYAESVRLGGETVVLPPRAEALAAVTPEELRPLQISARKAEYIRDLCGEIANGSLDLHALAALPADRADALLVARRGIGPTTSAWLLMFGAGHPDAWPPGDVGLHRALRTLLGTHEGAAVDDLVARFSGLRSWLAVALWASQRVGRRGSTGPGA